jgi:vacuolar-type H+-ATPase subunit I/STV1
MPNIQKQIDTLKAEISRLEKEQEKAEQEKRALQAVTKQVTSVLKENGVSLEAYIRFNLIKVSRIVQKFEAEQPLNTEKPVKTTAPSSRKKKTLKARKAKNIVKIPAGRYSKLPSQPEQIFEVKEKGPRPKALKAYAEEVGLEAFLEKCRISR